MYVRWLHRRKSKYNWRNANKGDVLCSAILVKNTRVDGKPKQQHIAYLVGFTESAAEFPGLRCHIWDEIDNRLDHLGNQVTPEDRAKIEATIAKKLPRPTAAEYKDAARDNAHFFGWEWVSEKQRAVLQDDAEQFRGALSQIDEYRTMAGFGPRKAL